MQEAYRPPCIKYSICCTILGVGGTVSLARVPLARPGQGTSLSRLGWGAPLSGPGWGTPHVQTWQGIPRKGPRTSDWGTPWGRDLKPVTGVPAQKGHGTSGSIMGWRWVTPPPRPPPPGVDRQTPVKIVPSRRTTYAVCARSA